MTSDTIGVSPSPGSIVVDDAGNEIGFQTSTGVVPLDGGEPPTPETAEPGALTPDPWPLDGHDPLGAFAPPESPQDYQLEVVDRDNTPELEAFKEAQAFFYETGIDQVTASFLWRQAQLAVAKPLSNVEIELAGRRTMADLVRRHGDDGAKELVERAKSEIKRAAAKQPAVYEWLQVTGLGNDPWLIERLAAKAEIRAARGRAATPSPVLSAPSKLSTPASIGGVAQAREQLAQRMGDRAWYQRYMDGDPGARAEALRLNETIASAAG